MLPMESNDQNEPATKADIERLELKLDAILEAFNAIGTEVGSAMEQLTEGGIGGLVKGLMGRD